MACELLLTHAWILAQDPREQEIMRPFPPLGLQYLVAWLRREGFPGTEWYDSTFARGPDAIIRAVEDADPRVVGLYGHTITRPTSLWLARTLVAGGRRVIAGGPDPVQYADEYLDGGVEVIVVGEGERTTQALMEHLRANAWAWNRSALGSIDGLIFRDDAGATVRTAPRALIRPLETLPWPHRDRADLDGYFDAWRARHGETALSVSTSRGCPYHCAWCSKQVYGDTFRRREVDDVIAEVEHLRDTYDPDQIWFVDDVFTINKAWVHRFCAAMVARRVAMPFYLVARPETLDKPLLQALRDAGCYRIYMSAESGAQHVLDAMDKRSTVEQIDRAARMMREVGLELGTFVMFGYPTEEKADVEATIQMLHRLDPEVALLSVAHPMKGTPFYEQVKNELIDPPGWAKNNGGRLAFKMRFPHEFYEVTQRRIWAERGVKRKLANGTFDRELLGMAARWPFYRAAFEWYGRA